MTHGINALLKEGGGLWDCIGGGYLRRWMRVPKEVDEGGEVWVSQEKPHLG